MPDPRRMTPPALLLLAVSALTGAAAWLGVDQAPAGPDSWSGFVAQTAAAGSLSFVSVTRVSGVGTSAERATGAIDFGSKDATQRSVIHSPGAAPQWSEVSVVGGHAYERPGTDGPDGPRFSGSWTRIGSFALAPFAPLTAGPAPEPVGGDPLTRVGTGIIGGAAATEYRLTPVSITCLDSAGTRSEESVAASVWIDGEGRIRRLTTRTTVAAFGFESTRRTVTTFGRFGGAVSVTAPAAVTGPPPASARSGLLSGCLVTS